MANDRQNARQQIEKLVQFFDSNIYQFKSPTFNETQTRGQLIDPFFESLGWDVHNRLMQPLFRQEVVPESRMKSSLAKEVREQEPLFPKKDTLGKENKEYTSILDYIAEDEYKVNSKEAVKKPDYRFRIGGQTKFFVEAKKPFVDLAKSQSSIFQVKRYGFSGRVPLAVLTDFEEFRAFDCTQRPAFEKPKLGIIKDFDLTYKNYLDQFDRLYDTFSRDAVVGGSLETLTKKMMLKRTGDFALDREFLEDLSKWREELARDIAKHPKNRRLLNDYTLNEAVQRILDRIVFIRVCEDREIEVENTLLAILRMWKERPGSSLYSLLNDLFKKRRDLYNGLLFSPHPCEELEIGNDVLIKIMENLNYPFSPYHFNEIGVEILGSIYEKFLGKTIHLAPKNVVIKEKPEVRKAGGVYYTPQYIVRYIVDNTLGKLLYEEMTPSVPTKNVGTTPPSIGGEISPPCEGGVSQRESLGQGGGNLKLTPKQVSKLKIIDIACGSGSFLLGAFQKLIDYHIEWYTAHPQDIKIENNVPDAYKDADGNYHLSPRKKRDILVNNIYGVDIDRQAVEVTQMSLYLKVLEGENAETLNPQMTLALKEVYLPSLAKNIKCGNSLIGTDFTSQGALFDEEAQRKVNPFDWEMEFPEILGSKQNPTQNPSHPSPIGEGKGGVQGPSASFDELRIRSGHGFDVVIGNPPYILMQDEFVDDVQLAYLKSKYEVASYKIDTYHLFIEKGTRLLRTKGLIGYIVPSNFLTNNFLVPLRRFIVENTEIKEINSILESVFPGVSVNNAVFVLSRDTRTPMQKEATLRTCSVGEEFLDIRDSKTFCQNEFTSSKEILFKYSISGKLLEKIETKTKALTDLATINFGMQLRDRSKFPKDVINIKTKSDKVKLTKKHVQCLTGKDVNRYSVEWSYLYCLEDRQAKRGGCWDLEIHHKKNKIIIRQIGEYPICGLDKEGMNCLNTVFMLVTRNEKTDVTFLLGLLNSQLIRFYWNQKFYDERGAFPKIKGAYLEQLPIRTIDFTKPAEKKMHDDLVSLVEKMLELNKQLPKSHFDSEKEPIERQIAATDKKIDELVYKLYGLTEEEISIVEGKT